MHDSSDVLPEMIEDGIRLLAYAGEADVSDFYSDHVYLESLHLTTILALLCHSTCATRLVSRSGSLSFLPTMPRS